MGACSSQLNMAENMQWIQNLLAGAQRVSCFLEEAEGWKRAGRERVFQTDHKMSSVRQYKPC